MVLFVSEAALVSRWSVDLIRREREDLLGASCQSCWILAKCGATISWYSVMPGSDQLTFTLVLFNLGAVMFTVGLILLGAKGRDQEDTIIS